MSDTPQTLPDVCAAQPQGAGMHCARCDLAWHTASARPPCDPITFGRMMLVLEKEAEQIEWTMREVAPAIGAQPSAERLRVAAVYRRIWRLVDLICSDAELMAKVKALAERTK